MVVQPEHSDEAVVDDPLAAATMMIRPRQRRQQQQLSVVARSQENFPRQSLVITSATVATSGSRKCKAKNGCAVVLSLMVLVCFWFVCFVLLMARSGGGNGIHSFASTVHDAHGQIKNYRADLRHDRLEQAIRQEHKHEKEQRQQDPGLRSPKIVAKPHLVSRMPNKVVATADVRGNLGPATVVVQTKPGTDWIHDRWQAASNMHGKQIPGEHWIQLEFQDTAVAADRIVLDWETAYADEYVLEASLEPISGDNHKESAQVAPIWVLFDGRNKQDVATMRSVSESGKSPGVDEPRPLHIVHEIQLLSSNDNNNRNAAAIHKPFRFLRLHILKSVTGWGVSLWQFDVYGFRADELQTSR